MGTKLRPLEYATTSEAPERHKVALGYFFGGMTPRAVAMVMGMSVKMAEMILTYPPNQEWLRAQAAAAEVESQARLARFDDLVTDTVKLHAQELKAALDGKREKSPSVVNKLLSLAYKHDPNGTFAPRTKHEKHKTVKVLATLQVMQLRRDAAAQGLDFERVEDAEFEEIRSLTDHAVKDEVALEESCSMAET